MLKKEPDHFLRNTDFSFAEIAYDGSDNEIDSKWRDLIFRDVTEQEISSFNLESASIVGELFMHNNTIIDGVKNTGLKIKEQQLEKTLQNEVGHVSTFALINDKLFQVVPLIAPQEIKNTYGTPEQQEEELQEYYSQLFVPVKVVCIGFSHLWEDLSLIKEFSTGSDGLMQIEKQVKDLTSRAIRQDHHKKSSYITAQNSHVQAFDIEKEQSLTLNLQNIKQTQASHNNQWLVNKFRLSRLGFHLSFGAQTQKEMQQWLDALLPYIIQYDIWTNYHFADLLGQGSYGKVFLATRNNEDPQSFNNKSQNILNKESSNDPKKAIEEPALTSLRSSKRSKNTAEQVAIKIMEKRKVIHSENGSKCLVREVRVHWMVMDCDGVMQLLEIFEDDQFIYLVLEYQKQGSLLKQIMTLKRLTEKQAKVVMTQLLLAMDYMHAKRILHRDIKLDNILINQIEEKEKEFSVKIADFGLATVIPEGVEKIFERCGTPCYVAPEILRGVGYTTKCDLFSLGSLLFNLLTGRFLFKGQDKLEILHHNKVCNLSQIDEYLLSVSKTCSDLLKKMLQPNPDKRPSAREALLHPWFKQDEEVIKDLLIFNDNLSKNSLAFLKNIGTPKALQQNSYQDSFFNQNQQRSLFNSFAYGPSMFNHSRPEQQIDNQSITKQNDKAENSSVMIEKDGLSEETNKNITFSNNNNSNIENVLSIPKDTLNITHISPQAESYDLQNQKFQTSKIRPLTPGFSQSRKNIRLSYFQSIKDSRDPNSSSSNSKYLNQSIKNNIDPVTHMTSNFRTKLAQNYSNPNMNDSSSNRGQLSSRHHSIQQQQQFNICPKPKLIIAKYLQNGTPVTICNQQEPETKKDRGNYIINKSKFYKESKPEIQQQFNYGGSWASSNQPSQKKSGEQQQPGGVAEKISSQNSAIKKEANAKIQEEQRKELKSIESKFDSQYCDSNQQLKNQANNKVSKFSNKGANQKQSQFSINKQIQNRIKETIQNQISQFQLDSDKNCKKQSFNQECQEGEQDNALQQNSNSQAMSKQQYQLEENIQPEQECEVSSPPNQINKGRLSNIRLTFDAPSKNLVYDSLIMHQGMQMSKRNQPQIRRIIVD